MIDLNKMTITTIQFFDYSDENTEGAEYSANIIIDEKLVVQLSGNKEESNAISIPSAVECYYNDEDLQDWACENLDIDLVKKFLDDNDIENNANYLRENGELIS